VTLLAAGAFSLLSALFPFPAGRLAEARSGGAVFLLDTAGRLVARRADAEGMWRLPVGLDRVSPWLVKATVAAEDRRFYAHPGVDPAAVLRAAAQNVTGGRRVSGASTISMQAVRLLTPRRRTWRAKLLESFRALQLERCAGKDDILALYLNRAPYGGNVVGAEAAACLYFGKPAAALTPGEAALLAGVPQQPARFHPRRHLAAALERRGYVFDRMEALGQITPAERRAAEAQPIRVHPRPRPAAAPC
jgi:penicillin-binding protein 1C